MVIMVIPQTAPMLLTRNLLYTGITRAKKLLVIIGTEKVINFMIQNVDSKKRNTGLEFKMKEGLGGRSLKSLNPYLKEVSIKNFYDNILDLIYPPVCGICGKLNQNYLCKKCQKVLENQSKFVIDENQDFNQNFNKHLYIFKYKGIIRRMILNYKFNEKSYLYITFVNFLLKNEKFFKILKSYDTIIPVPISSERKNERGYNQSELLAKELAKKLNIECVKNCLIKNKNIIEQSKLNKEERQKNIQGVYILKNKEKLINKKLLLIDDIYTTGSTVNECCKILKQANPRKIDVFTIAKD